MLFAIARPGPITISDIATGCVLMFLGAGFICFRVGVMLDRQRRTATTWWGLLVPFHKTEHPYSRTGHVTVSREERRPSKGPNYEVFPVSLEGAGADAITIHEPRDHDKARQLAEEIAKFIQLGIRDRSSGNEIIREAGALDQSLRDRVRLAGRSVPLPARPPGARAIFSYGGTRAPTTIDIPPIGRNVHWLWFVLTVMFAAGLTAIMLEYYPWWRRRGAFQDMGMLYHFLTWLGIFLLAGLPLMLRTVILRERLVVSRDELVVTRRDIFGTKTTRLTSGEIEEVEVIQAKYPEVFGGGLGRVLIRNDRGSVKLGGALSVPGEVNWLSDVLVHVLSSASR
jgi:hypothetical protein